MFTSILNWLDHRTGIKGIWGMMMLEEIPGGAKWRYVWGSALAFVFSIQLITGLLLMTAYSPSSSQAWSSVHFIQYQMDFGWLIRGLHHFGSQTMMVLIGLHMLQVVIAGAHLPPREINWWLGMGLFGLTFGLSLTGYLLPWDQKGYWATRVATNIAGTLPEIGPHIRQIIVGGPDYGNHTITRFYALHVGILPLGMIVLIFLHLMVFRRHGVTSAANVEGLVTKPENDRAPGTEMFWPRQAFYDMLICILIFGVMLGLVFYGHGHPVTVTPKEGDPEPGLYEHWAKAGTRGLGANLDAAADRQTPNYPARPEWYFLFLFQLLKYFEGDLALVGTVFIPNGVMLLVTILPLFGIGPLRKLGHYFGVLVMLTLLLGVGMLTLLAFKDDSSTGILWGMIKHTDEKAIKKAKAFEDGVHEAEAAARRACQMAMDGTPVAGGHELLRNDPLTQGHKLFQINCGGCHNFSARGEDRFKSLTDGKSASDLGEYGTKEWIRGLLKNPLDDRFFGLVRKMEKDAAGKPVKENGKEKFTHILTRMDGWRDDIHSMREDEKWSPDQIAKQEADFDLIAAWLADHARPKEFDDPKLTKEERAKLTDAARKFATEAQAAFFNSKVNRCSTCHTAEQMEIKANVPIFTSKGAKTAPDLTNYASAEWIRAMIMRPGHKTRYFKKNQMPTFRPLDGPGSELAKQEFRETHEHLAEHAPITHLSDIDREMIIRFMRRDYRPVYGGATIK